MTKKNSGINYNGVLLEEYLKDKEQLKDEAERKKLVEEYNQKLKSYKKPRAEYKTKKERNGKVKILNQREKNELVYKDEVKKALVAKDFKKATFLTLFCGTNVPLNSKQIYDVFSEVLDPKSKNPSSTVRWHLHHLMRSVFSKYVEEYGGSVKKYIISEEGKNLTIEKAYKMVLTKKSKKTAPIIKEEEKPIIKEEEKPSNIVPELEPIEAEEKYIQAKEILEAFLSGVENKKGFKSLISIEGTVNINIFIDPNSKTKK